MDSKRVLVAVAATAAIAALGAYAYVRVKKSKSSKTSTKEPVPGPHDVVDTTEKEVKAVLPSAQLSTVAEVLPVVTPAAALDPKPISEVFERACFLLIEGADHNVDIPGALRLFLECASRGNARAAAIVGILRMSHFITLKRDLAEGMAFLAGACNAGDAVAVLYLETVKRAAMPGLPTLSEDADAAATASAALQSLLAENKPATDAASRPDLAVSAFVAGLCLFQGVGVTAPDRRRAVELYAQSAKLGLGFASRNLGVAYASGAVGDGPDMSLAFLCFRTAARQGYADATSYLANCYRNGFGVDPDLTEAVRLYATAAEAGFAVAQYNLGVCFQSGLGVLPDQEQARRWLSAAVDQGDVRAQQALARLQAAAAAAASEAGAAPSAATAAAAAQ